MKKAWVILLLLLLCVITHIAFRAYNYYAPPKLRQPYKTFRQDDTIRIAYIGDSWAYMHKNHNCKLAKMISESIHHPVSVHSFGICGLTSKEIYEALYDNSDFKQFMQAKGFHFCFVSAGINDTYKKISTRYYKKSMEGIIELLLANNIHPIILEIPDYNIIKANDNQKTDKKLLRLLSMFINGTSLDCKQDFRNALDELINEKQYQDKIGVVRYKLWNNKYVHDQRKIYRKDGMHLNSYGYDILDSIITEQILHQPLFNN